MINLKSKGSMTVLLAAALMFSQCKKDEQAYTPETEAVSAQTIAATSATTTVPQPIDVSKATLDAGYCWRIRSVGFGVTGDSGTSPTVSTVRIFENGVELGPAHSLHADIRTYGKGRFSHWGSDLYFSASDNSNPTTNGRKYTFVTTSGTLSTTTSTTTTTTTTTTTDPLALSNLVGYANVGGKTTGGQGGSTVTVTSLSAFKSAVESSSPMIIKVSGVIKGTGYVNVKSNKTILGVNGGTIDGVSLHVMSVSNVIVQNLIMRFVVGDDCLNIKYANHIWVDHCDLYNDRTHSDWEYYDGLIDITRQSDYVTLSWNKFHDSYKPILIGADDSNTDDIGHLRVTIYKNYFYNVSERGPRARFGYIHSFNNYHKNTSGYSVSSSMGAVVRTDANYFESVTAPIRTDIGAKPGYISGASTNKYVSSGSNKITTSASSWTPSSIYSYSVIPVDNVPSTVTAGAGPR